MRNRTLWTVLLLSAVGACSQDAGMPPDENDNTQAPGEPGGQEPPADAVSVAIAAPKEMTSNQTVTLRATITGMDNQEVRWTSSGGGVFEDEQANPARFTAPPVDAPAVIQITATSLADSSYSAEAEIVVQPLEPLMAQVNESVSPATGSITQDAGPAQPVAASRDADGVQSDFIEGQVLIRPRDQAQLEEFLERYEGTILGDDAVPEPPASLGITLTDEQRRPTEYLVRINLASVSASGFDADAAAVGLGGVMEFSSEGGLLTMAGIARAAAEGYDVSPDFVSYPAQNFPITLFQTEERPAGAGFTDAFATARFQATGSQSNVTLAWQFLSAHGVQRRTRIAIIDDGFWLDTTGQPRSADTDFPANPVQYDFYAKDYVADGANQIGCGPGNPCYWHGTGSAGVAAGIINNRSGDAGTGGLIADPILLKTPGARRQINLAIRTAIAWGADVVSMSLSGDCNRACRIYDRDHTPFDDAVADGSRTVFVAAAGNGDAAGVGYDVGEPRFVHPCIEEHVICVGALNDGANTRIGYSNFGGGVDIFAPTNIPAMTQPGPNDSNPNGPASPQPFGGTSASTPFVAGVAAMMKAINPDLNSDQVEAILRDTGRIGIAEVTRHIDALAALRRAAQGIDGVRDRFEVGPGGNNLNPTVLAGPGPWREANLNVHNEFDRDVFRFDAPGRSTMTIDLEYPEGLGAIPLVSLEEQGNCGAAQLTSETAIPGGRGRRLTYALPGGPFELTLGGGLINAYNLGISMASDAAAPDGYEPNNTPGTASPLYTIMLSDRWILPHFNPRFSIAASLHAGDEDYYTVRGGAVSLAEQVLMNAAPSLKLYNNESPMNIEVFTINPDGSTGPRIAQDTAQSCTPEGVTIKLEEDRLYLVRVSGVTGRYQLQNGVEGEKRFIPYIIRDRIWEVLHPQDPIERFVRFPEWFIIHPEVAVGGVRVAGPNLHMQLFDFEGNLVAEGEPLDDPLGERLGLEDALIGQLYALQVAPVGEVPEGQVFSLTWETVESSRTSGNLILNGTAEDGEGNDANGPVETIPNWMVPDDGRSMPTVIYYGSGEEFIGPTYEGPGPEDRGYKVFAGGPENLRSAIQQVVSVDPSWEAPIDESRVQFTFTAFLGGLRDQQDDVAVTLVFLDENGEAIAEVAAASVGPREREGRTGLWPMERVDTVPPGTSQILVELEFRGTDGVYNHAYADNIELSLQEYAP